MGVTAGPAPGPPGWGGGRSAQDKTAPHGGGPWLGGRRGGLAFWPLSSQPSERPGCVLSVC